MHCMGNSGYFPQGKQAAILRRSPAFCVCAVFSCFHTTGCEAYSLRQEDMGSYIIIEGRIGPKGLFTTLHCIEEAGATSAGH